MRIVQINATCGKGSTGKICVEVSKLLCKENIENYILYCSGSSQYPYGIKYTSDISIKLQALKSRVLGNYGFNSQIATKRLLGYLDGIKPDIVHLHNLHGHNCNLTMLFRYLKEKQIKVFWTFHDCWAFTGYCPHFDMIDCTQWKNRCTKCPQRKQYSWFFDRSSQLQKRKEKLLSDLDLTIITPSKWLADRVRESFLKDYPIQVIHNGIDLSVFQPTENGFRKKYGCENKKILLGVAFDWNEKKGLDVFLRLAKDLPEEYQIVLVGTNEKTEAILPDNIISIRRTESQRELAGIYTAADVFVNATREDTFPTVNIEALACGTPIVTFNTGGSPESIDCNCGVVVSKNSYESLKQGIFKLLSREKPCKKCLSRAEEYDSQNKYLEYLGLYSVTTSLPR